MLAILIMSGHNIFCGMRNSGGGFLPDKKYFIVGSAYATTRASAKSAEVILVEEPRYYTTALKDVRDGRFSKSTVVVFDRSPNPELALSKIDAKVKKVHLLYNFPEGLAEAKTTMPAKMKSCSNNTWADSKNYQRMLTNLVGLRFVLKLERRQTSGSQTTSPVQTKMI